MYLLFVLPALFAFPPVSTFGYLQRHTVFRATCVWPSQAPFFAICRVAGYSFCFAGCSRWFAPFSRRVAHYFTLISIIPPLFIIAISTWCFAATSMSLCCTFGVICVADYYVVPPVGNHRGLLPFSAGRELHAALRFITQSHLRSRACLQGNCRCFAM